MRNRWARWLVVLVLSFGGMRLAGQAPGPAAPGLHPILAKVFGDVKGFSAMAQVRVEGGFGRETMEMPMRFSYWKGNMRAEMDMTTVRSELLSADLVENLRQIGMDRVVTIMKEDGKQDLVLYPNLRAEVVASKVGETEPGQRRGKPKVREVKVGEEVVEGVTCEKSRFEVEEARLGVQEATVWRDRARDGFPVQIQLEQGGMLMRVVYRDVTFERPGKDQFEIPKGYQQYDTVQAVMKKALERLLEKQ